RRAGRALAVAAAVLVALGGGAAAGYFGQQAIVSEPTAPDRVTVRDDLGRMSVVVPADWVGAEATDGWLPPNGDDGVVSPGLSVGTQPDWVDEPAAEGVFVGLLPGDELPPSVPQHPECDSSGVEERDETDGDESVTAYFRGCPDGVTVERLVQVTRTQLLWVQVRSADEATANQVLDGVEVYGF
ncbi:MAG: protein kinase, partial [Nocardioides sp.]|nr:protein kinase [Nocardioides sp.]